MHFQRQAEHQLKLSANQYPVVTVIGPRQVGKTTMVKYVFDQLPYVNLEDPDIRLFAEHDSKGFMAQFPDGAIIDEIQNVPKLLSYIQVIVDEKQKNGMFVLTGSQQLDLNSAISQSLAGRTSILFLLPLTITELQAQKIDLTLDDYLLHGFLPRNHAEKLDPKTAYRNYVRTYLERDLRKITNVHDLTAFQKFIRLCASRVGQVLKYDNLANEVGISATTIKHWLSILEASYIIFKVQPYFENFGKRIIKSPKLYFFDVGLVSYLIDIENQKQLSRDPLRGYLVENLVVLELMKARMNLGLEANLYYYRDSHQNEIDIIYKKANQLIPIEIKSSSTFDSSFLKVINYYRKLAAERVPHAWIVYAGNLSYQVNGAQLINYKQAHTIVTSE